VPFSVALSLYRDARNPRSYDDEVVHDRAILDLASRIKITVAAGQGRQDSTASVTIWLKDGREVSRRVSSFKGTPQRPLNQAELKEKFMLLTQHLDRGKMEATFERLQHIESEKAVDWVSV
jgi:2-methylcitrate dehydratase PrpD